MATIAVDNADNEPLTRPAYNWTTTNFSPASPTTDFLTLTGSATKIVRLKQLILSGTATSASNVLVFVVRRSGTHSGGTASIQTAQPRDLRSPPATAVLRLYTANPASLATKIGDLDAQRLNLAPAANGSIDRAMFQYTWLNDQAPTLRGVNDMFALNLANAALPAGGAYDISMTWTEDSLPEAGQ